MEPGSTKAGPTDKDKSKAERADEESHSRSRLDVGHDREARAVRGTGALTGTNTGRHSEKGRLETSFQL